ncbi:winged helix-turn-helix domain-containing protein [Streptomyces sp. NPDC057413]|uniref:helix-turn-helix domain-containing protein n=1 Tax=Streptomyces sp. NPDC057413 TaxID=3346124 RepID=UPI0036B29434
MLRAPVSERRLDILRWLKHPTAPTPARTRRPGDPTPDGDSTPDGGPPPEGGPAPDGGQAPHTGAEPDGTPAPDPLTAPHGVTADAVAAGLGLPPRLVRADLALLARVGVLKVRRAGAHTYYRRDEIRIAEVARMFEKGW